MTASEASRKPHFWYVFFINHKMLKIFRKNDPPKKPFKNNDNRPMDSRKPHFWYGFFADEKMSKNGARKNRVKIVAQTSKTSGINGFSRAQKKGPETPVLKMGVKKGDIKF